MMQKLLAILLVLGFSFPAASGEEAPVDNALSIYAELEGRVEVVESSPDAVTVRIVPREGLPVRLEKAVPDVWRPHAGRWIEAEGHIYGDGVEPCMDLWNFSLERRAPDLDDLPVECKGILLRDANGLTVRNALGKAMLVDWAGRLPHNASVEIKGILVESEGRWALSVKRMELD